MTVMPIGKRVPASRRVSTGKLTASLSKVPAAYRRLPLASRMAACNSVPAGRFSASPRLSVVGSSSPAGRLPPLKGTS
ncbi:hypothetical protein D3C85_1702950 [compost metagenome]